MHVFPLTGITDFMKYIFGEAVGAISSIGNQEEPATCRVQAGRAHLPLPSQTPGA